MMYRISHPTKKLTGEITLTASKSESNRALIIQALCSGKFEIKNLAAAEDTVVLQKILDEVKLNSSEPETRDYIGGKKPYDVGAAGTTMRFLTAYLATQPGSHKLTGSNRMLKRPIEVLVDALNGLGAEIKYYDNKGFPPLWIQGKVLGGGENGGKVEIDGSISSQYISALLLISPRLKNGLQLKFKGEITSRPYINMTLKMMEEFGVHATWSEDDTIISVPKQIYHTKDTAYYVEADWSSASYWYGFSALADEVDFTIKGLKKDSLQGDASLVNIFKDLGVLTNYIDGGVHLCKDPNFSIKSAQNKGFKYNFIECPDLAQTIATVATALRIPAIFSGLHTLRIKETDRTAALKNELALLNTEVKIIDNDSIEINYGAFYPTPQGPISTYDDHRMAMAFTIFAMINPINIKEPEVVKKSYPAFWDDLKKVGFVIEEV